MKQLRTLSLLLLDKVEKYPKSYALGTIKKNRVSHQTFKDHFLELSHLSSSLIHMGIRPNTKIGILADTSPEWHKVDLASIFIRAVVVPLYPNFTPQDIEFILNHAEVEYLFIDSEAQLSKLIPLLPKLSNLKGIISFKKLSSKLSSPHHNILFHEFSDLLAAGTHTMTESEYIQLLKENRPEDVVSIIYTSGTTGDPKGVTLTNLAVSQMLTNILTALHGSISHYDKTLTFLPLSHVLGRCDSLLPLIFGLESIYAENIANVGENMALAKPTIVLTVPRLLEKIHAKILETFDKKPAVTQKLFAWATEASKTYFEKIDQDISPTPLEVFQKNLAYKLLYSNIYNKLGGKIRFLISGGAPLSPNIIKFLRYANLTVLEGYGLTETAAPCFLNPVEKQIPGSVGLPIGEVQVTLAEDGEILLKSKAIFSGYHKREDLTQDAFTTEGWFKTGDIGVFTDEGYLQITDRKKDIIITAGGKNIAPQKIEAMAKKQKYISDFVVIGDRRKYLIGIVGISKDPFLPHLKSLGLKKDCTLQELAAHPKVESLIWDEIEKMNSQLASFETIKRIFVAPDEFSIEKGFLTPSMKIKRKVIERYYEREIDALYQ